MSVQFFCMVCVIALLYNYSYSKFTKSKDLSGKTLEDLRCIFGPRKQLPSDAALIKVIIYMVDELLHCISLFYNFYMHTYFSEITTEIYM